MNMFNFIKDKRFLLPKSCAHATNDTILTALQNTRLLEHWEFLNQQYSTIPICNLLVIIPLLAFGEDPYYNDLIKYCDCERLDVLWNRFKTFRDLEILNEFVTEDDSTAPGIQPPIKRLKSYIGHSDIEASTKIGTQEESSEYRDTSSEQVLGFSDNQDIMILDMSNSADETRHQEDYQQTNSLARFLERPRIIRQIPWVPATSFNGTFGNPLGNNVVDIRVWKEYIASAIELKADNFRMFRADGLKLEFRVNGSPFHYGRLYAGYCAGDKSNLPYSGQEIPENAVLTATNMGSFGDAPLKTTLSQWPGVFIDPSTNIPQELIVPFMWGQNYANLTATSIVEQMGYLKVWQLVPLMHANGSTDNVTLTITASLVNPVLAMPTTKLVYSGEAGQAGSGAPKGRKNNRNKRSKAPQNPKSNTGNDEYGKGVVSAPASALANFAGTLEKVPIIGNYATATKIAANGVSQIASLFGFSKPVSVAAETKYTFRPVGSLATTSGEDMSEKLTIDPKQEITIDPQVTGLQDIDEMSFAHIFKRESLLVQLNWTEADDEASNLAHILVSPQNRPIADVSFAGVEFAHYHTALSWAINPFMYWRGTIKYRFQIVASQFHRGRLAIVYNPAADNSATLPDQAETYQQFIDITEQRDVTIEVRHGQAVPWIPTTAPPTFPFITTGTGSFAEIFRRASNGTFSVYVLNQLASPTGTAPIKINVYISAGDDFMVASPGGTDFPFLTPYTEFLRSLYTAESGPLYYGEADVADDKTRMENMPVKSYCHDIVLNGDDIDTPDVDHETVVFFGEQIVSLRSLLKRYCFYMGETIQETPTLRKVGYISLRHSQFPQARGRPAPGNYHLGYSRFSIDTNPICGTYVNYYSRGFLAHRGAIRWKYLIAGLDASRNVTQIRAKRITQGLPELSRFRTAVNINPFSSSVDTVRADAVMARANQVFAGATLVNYNLNLGVEFEHPFYCPERFVWTNMNRQISGTPPSLNFYNSYQLNYQLRDAHEVDFCYANANIEADQFVVERYVAAGEDFSLHYFLGAPVVGNVDLA